MMEMITYCRTRQAKRTFNFKFQGKKSLGSKKQTLTSSSSQERRKIKNYEGIYKGQSGQNIDSQDGIEEIHKVRP